MRVGRFLTVMLACLAPSALQAQSAPVALDRPAPAQGSGTVALDSGQPSGAVPARYTSGGVPFIYSISYSNYNSWYTGADRDDDCVSEIKEAYEIDPAQTGPWMWRKHMWETYVPEEDQAQHPVVHLIYCSPKKVAVEVSTANLGGSAYFDIDAEALPIPAGREAEAACAAKAARLPQAEPRLTMKRAEIGSMIYNSEVFEDPAAKLAFVVSCTDIGEVVLAVAGANDRAANLQALKAAWNRL